MCEVIGLGKAAKLLMLRRACSREAGATADGNAAVTVTMVWPSQSISMEARRW